MSNQLSVSGLCFPDFDLARTLDAVQEAGVAATTLQTAVVRESGWDKGIAQIKASGIAVAGFVGPFPKDLGNRDSWQAARTDYIETLDAAASLGSQAVYSVTGPLVTESRADSVAMFGDFIAPVTAYAASVGVQLAVEPTIHEYAWVSFVHTLDEVLELNRQSGLGVCFDLYHVWDDPMFDDFLSHHLDLIGLVQVGDTVLEEGKPVKVVPGDGTIPLDALLGKIAAAGYRGVFDIEQFGPRMETEGTVEAARRAVKYIEKATTPAQPV
ncbi:sugar phosphate isomerase/epimerase [Nocardia sp. 348MFTsu5.1]|uniref:sugar phosphate isomerase/epimerase family protein n=1 Tax=Nocardia sp. 348MFTsu5.1 TaxID=1172185 RepID=UPI000364FB65|nr:sugar phosphate isomerase/epimerase family protein [Nocardia sp. 348MFTsu5.1]